MPPTARRIGPPVATLAAVMLASGLAYHHAHRLPSHALHQAVATGALGVYFVSIAFGALYVYASAYRRGAAVGERIVATTINPFLWMTKEVLRVGAFYPVADAFFFYLNPLHVTLACTVVSEMGIAELLCRSARRRRGEAVRVWSGAPVAAAIAPQLLVIPMQLRPEDAAASFFVFLKLYARIVHGTSLEH